MDHKLTALADHSCVRRIVITSIVALLLAFGLAPFSLAQSYRLDNWMGDLKSVLEYKQLNEIAMVGSHDAGTYQLGPAQGWCGTKAFQLGILPVAALDPISPFLWKTQTLSISDQLKYGVRMFDFRPCYSRVEKRWKFFHGFWNGKNYLGPMGHAIEPELNRIAAFARAHPSEILIFYIRKIAPDAGGPRLKRELHQMIMTKFRGLIATKQDGFSPTSTYHDFISKRKNVIFIDESGVLAKGAGIPYASSPYWSKGDENLSLQDSNNKIISASTLKSIADRTNVYIASREKNPRKFQFVSAFPPADNKKYYVSVIANLTNAGRLSAASSKFLNVDVIDALAGLTCPAGSFYDPRNQGECWKCPGGYSRTVFPVTGAAACERRTPVGYSKADYDGKPTGVLGPLSPKTKCKSGAVLNVRSGNCYRCPASSRFTVGFEVGDPNAGNACMTPARVQSARARSLGPARNDRYFDPAFSFVEIGKRLNVILSNRFRGPWRQRAFADKVNVVVVDNVGMTPGEPIMDIYKMLNGRTTNTSLIRSVIDMNKYKTPGARKQAKIVKKSPNRVSPSRPVTPKPRPRPTPAPPKKNTASPGVLLRNPSSGLCLDSNGRTGAASVTKCSFEKASQRWILTPAGAIKNPGSNLCLDPSGGSNQAFVKSCTGTSAQRWKYNRSTGELRSYSRNLCLDSYGRIGSGMMNGCHGKEGNQRWTVMVR